MELVFVGREWLRDETFPPSFYIPTLRLSFVWKIFYESRRDDILKEKGVAPTELFSFGLVGVTKVPLLRSY